MQFGVAYAAEKTLPQLPQPNATFESGTLHVDRYGVTGKPIVFIPGLSSGPWSWAEQIARFSKTNVVYALTLPGFDGRAAVSRTDLFDAFAADFWKLLADRNIDKPVVVGHSLGGTLSFFLAEQHPQALRGIVALDGLPIFPTMAQVPDSDLPAKAAAIAKPIATQTHAQLLAYDMNFMQSIGTAEPSFVAPGAEREARSEPTAVAAWLQEDLSHDLRPQLSRITIPALELMPYAAPSPYTEDQTLAFYRGLTAGAPDLQVVPIDGARHFAMLDKPQAVDAAITQFLAKLP